MNYLGGYAIMEGYSRLGYCVIVGRNVDSHGIYRTVGGKAIACLLSN
jgi:hypothetical protein